MCGVEHQLFNGRSRLRVEKEQMKSKLLKALSDDSMRRILSSTLLKAKSASDLSYETRLPLSSVYRYIHELNEAGLLTIERIVITDQGKKFDLYRSAVKSIRLDLEASSVNLDVQPNEDVETRFYRLWSALKEAK